MQSRHKTADLFLFELIREHLPGDAEPELPEAPGQGPGLVAFMILIAVLFLFYGLLFGFLSRP